MRSRTLSESVMMKVTIPDAVHCLFSFPGIRGVSLRSRAVPPRLDKDLVAPSIIVISILIDAKVATRDQDEQNCWLEWLCVAIFGEHLVPRLILLIIAVGNDAAVMQAFLHIMEVKSIKIDGSAYAIPLQHRTHPN